MFKSASSRHLSLRSVGLILWSLVLIALTFSSVAFANTAVIRSASDCAIAKTDAVQARNDALIGANYLAELDRYIAAGSSACDNGDFAGAEYNFAMVRGMSASE